LNTLPVFINSKLKSTEIKAVLEGRGFIPNFSVNKNIRTRNLFSEISHPYAKFVYFS
jgi:hypothetical protein